MSQSFTFRPGDLSPKRMKIVSIYVWPDVNEDTAGYSEITWKYIYWDTSQSIPDICNAAIYK